ncbi:glycerophosphodiester phosphodiesterase family protein [Flavobacterium sp. LAR06]|uniref:glycerophosphodiester phosphodiesterase family protein n=1 Tax=Flavobacterium sp. LAR06 TaxID=3064897 RepID=UPI0035C26569
MKIKLNNLFFLSFMLSQLNVQAQTQITPAEVIAMFKNFRSYPNYVMVAAHRGYWKDSPENTKPAYDAAIAIGADMVELDIRATLDDSTMVFHDACLNRMTSSSGPLNTKKYVDIKDLTLKNQLGEQTTYKMLRMREVFTYLKGKTAINLDIKDSGDAYLRALKKCLVAAKQIGVLNQLVVNVSNTVTQQQLMTALTAVGVTLDDCIFVPIIFRNMDYATIIQSYLSTKKIYAFELICKQDSDPLVPYIKIINDANAWEGTYSFWPEAPGGVVAEDPKTCAEVIRPYYFTNDGSTSPMNDGRGDWDWLMAKATPNFVVSDRPDLWIDYLTGLGKRKK